MAIISYTIPPTSDTYGNADSAKGGSVPEFVVTDLADDARQELTLRIKETREMESIIYRGDVGMTCYLRFGGAVIPLIGTDEVNHLNVANSIVNSNIVGNFTNNIGTGAPGDFYVIFTFKRLKLRRNKYKEGFDSGYVS